MAFPSVTNIDGFNPGPNSSSKPDTTQSPIGNVQMVGVFDVSLTPAAVAATTAAEQTFSATGVGVQPGDFVSLSAIVALNGVGINQTRVVATDEIGVTFTNPTSASITPTSGTYQIAVLRPQANWIKPASGYQMDF
jgi:hypothetical protein